jgi:DNA-binding HxlR family transcriptional regulator
VLALRSAAVPRSSSLSQALTRVGDRWTLEIVAALLVAPARFGELSERVEGIAPNTLTQRLRHLESESLLTATPYSERPLRLVYELTEEGRELAGALQLLEAWGAGHSEPADPDDDHCPLCGSRIDAGDADSGEPDLHV